MARKKESGGPSVPAYIVTFSDMVTLLLTFFVLLLTLAQVQDPELFNQGRDAFVKSIRYSGLGMLLGKRTPLEFGAVKHKYFIDKPDEGHKGRTIDARRERLRRIFREVDTSMATVTSEIDAQGSNFSVTKVTFGAGDASLNEQSKDFLRQFAYNLQQDNRYNVSKLYVVGLAGDEKTEKGQWILSAQRANAVGQYLKGSLGQTDGWSVYSWGAGPGDGKLITDGAAYHQSQILIAVFRE